MLYARDRPNEAGTKHVKKIIRILACLAKISKLVITSLCARDRPKEAVKAYL